MKAVSLIALCILALLASSWAVQQERAETEDDITSTEAFHLAMGALLESAIDEKLEADGDALYDNDDDYILGWKKHVRDLEAQDIDAAGPSETEAALLEEGIDEERPMPRRHPMAPVPPVDRYEEPKHILGSSKPQKKPLGKAIPLHYVEPEFKNPCACTYNNGAACPCATK